MDTNELFWQKQHAIYNTLEYNPMIRYESWQPCRWASNRAAIYKLKSLIMDIDTACEVGAGSAAFTLELQKQLGVTSICIDLAVNAKSFAERVAKDMLLTIDYRNEDLFTTNTRADLVLSLGVIEHFDEAKQFEFIKKCRSMTNRYVLISIPNQESPIFKNYINWAQNESLSYEEDHKTLTTDILIERCNASGLRVLHVDGFQVFLSEMRFWHISSPHDIPIYRSIRDSLVKIDKKYQSFPLYDFTYDDIPTMVNCELSLDSNDRLSYGFMTYVLAERI